MSKKELKTNACRILDKEKINYQLNTYDCKQFIDGCHIADALGQSYEQSFKTLVCQGKSKNYFVFAIPVDKELDLKKSAKAVGEKSVELIAVKDINKVTGYIRGGCTPLGMKKLYTTVIEKSALGQEKIIISGGRLGLQIIIAPQDLAKVTDATFDELI